MAEYEALIQNLRSIDEYDTGYAKLIYDAADAIEELSKLADAIPHVCECCVGCELEKKNGGCDHAFVLSSKRAMQYLIKPRWIPVTERLSDENDNVLIYGEWTGRSGATYREIWLTDLKEFLHQGYKPIAWMPLPEPPKEET